MKGPPIDWLLSSDPWVEYRTRLDLLGEPENCAEVISARIRMVQHPLIRSILSRLSDWPGPVVNSHKSAGQYFHLLPFIADLGFRYDEDTIAGVTDKILNMASEEGPFGVIMNIPEHFGGTGTDTPAWALCDAPRTAYSLAKLGLAYHPLVLKARDYMVDLGQDYGFPCVVSRELGKFRGPGRREDPCPYATLIMLELISLYENLLESASAAASVKSLLNVWENSMTRHPYMFFMGTDFRKLKAPLIWFDILHVCDTLSHFQYALEDHRFQQMVAIIESKASPDGCFTPESAWKAWNEWEFGQKKAGSPWLTFLVWRILLRAGY